MDGNGNGNDRYGVPAGGLSAWADADDSRPAVAHIDEGLEVDLVERRGHWGRVVCSNGWAGWVDARLLVNGGAPPPPAPPAPLPPAFGAATIAPGTAQGFGASDMATATAPAAFAPPPPPGPPPPGPAMAPTLAPSTGPVTSDATFTAYSGTPAGVMPPPAYPAAPPPPPPAAPAEPPRKPPWATGRGRLIIALILLVAVVAVALLVGGGEKASAGEIFLHPADQAGANTFTPSVATPPPGSNGPNATTAPAPSSDGLVRAKADVAGLYSGVRGAPNCDANKLAGYLESNPARGTPWARAEGIQQNQIRPFISGLTPAALRVDTRVTEYQFSGGRAVAKPAIMQAGTQVLLDREAMPRVRCVSGNPLGPARAVSDTPSYGGRRWPGFSPGTVVVLDPAPGTSIIVLVDPRTGLPFARVLGSVIVIDFDRPALGATVIVVEPGGPFTVAGTRFPPGSAITVAWDNPAVTLATPTADGAGNFAITVNAPATAAVGTHQVNITGGGLSVIQTVYVIPPVPR